MRDVLNSTVRGRPHLNSGKVQCVEDAWSSEHMATEKLAERSITVNIVPTSQVTSMMQT